MREAAQRRNEMAMRPPDKKTISTAVGENVLALRQHIVNAATMATVMKMFHKIGSLSLHAAPLSPAQRIKAANQKLSSSIEIPFRDYSIHVSNL